MSFKNNENKQLGNTKSLEHSKLIAKDIIAKRRKLKLRVRLRKLQILNAVIQYYDNNDITLSLRNFSKQTQR